MKKLALFLALVLLLTLTACGKPAIDGPGDDTTPTTTPLLGSNDGETYENTFFGLTCTIEEKGWKMYDADEMQDRNLPILDFGPGDDYNAVVNEAKEFYDMYAEEEETLATMAVRVENLNALYGYCPTAEEFVDMQKSMTAEDPSLKVETPTLTLDGKAYPALRVTWDEGGLVDTFVYIRVKDYMLIVEISCPGEDHAAEWLGWFDTL